MLSTQMIQLSFEGEFRTADVHYFAIALRTSASLKLALSLYLPVHSIFSLPLTLVTRGKPWLVNCDQGVIHRDARDVASK